MSDSFDRDPLAENCNLVGFFASGIHERVAPAAVGEVDRVGPRVRRSTPESGR